jgi:hypothetical protein
MPATATDWQRTSTLPRPANYQQMLDFFGIPPATMEKLDENIRRKRRRWYAKTNGGNPVGRQRAERVVELIAQVEQALKRGAEADVGGGVEVDAIPDEVFETLQELWRIIDEYVFNDDYDRALRVARTAVQRWGAQSAGSSALAWVVATGFESGRLAHPSVLREGIDAATRATTDAPADARNWESLATLLMAVDQADAAVSAIERARSHGGAPTPRLLALQAVACVRLGRPQDAMVAAVRAVAEAQRNAPALVPAVRSQCAAALVGWIAQRLPIRSAAELDHYVEMATTAAWCAQGVPEAEDLVRPHRMWAANAGRRVFTGSFVLRSFLAVLTGFLSLPVHNALRSTPAWKVLLAGMSDQAGRGATGGNGLSAQMSFQLVARPRYVQDLHGFMLAGLES